MSLGAAKAKRILLPSGRRFHVSSRNHYEALNTADGSCSSIVGVTDPSAGTASAALMITPTGSSGNLKQEPGTATRAASR